MESLFNTYTRRIKSVRLNFYRYLYSGIDWNDRLIAIKGARGVGKTTLILQHIKNDFPDLRKALYVSLDNLWFSTNSLARLVDYHYTHGGTHLFLDEVHRYPDWQTAIKNLYDDYPDLHIVYTGSSMLEIDRKQGDLSRRQIVYTLAGMSFREYLKFEGIADIPRVDIKTLLRNHMSIASSLTEKVKILPLFEKYLQQGYYPFYKDTYQGYGMRLQDVARQVIEADMPAVDDIQFSTIRKVRKMLMILAARVPHTPKMAELYRELETTREQGLKMLYSLERGGLLSLLSYEPKNYRNLSRPDKIYLENPNLMYALTERVDKGTLRETFFYNQVSAVEEVLLAPKGDFLVGHDMLFEVGGKNKSFEQIKDEPDSYLAIDDVEVGYGNKIPLWMFGLLY